MTEIPDHLLQRAQARRQALGLPVSGGANDAASSTAATGAPAGGGAVVAAASNLPKGPVAPGRGIEPVKAVPKAVPHYVEAFHRRKRIPVWAMPVLLGLPLWGVLYAGTLQPAPTGKLTVLAEGAVVYNNTAGCAACHGPAGAGAVGPQLSEKKVITTFANPLDQVRWVITGSEGHVGSTYGDTKKPKKGGMPAFGKKLSLLEIVSSVRHERETLSGQKFAEDAEGWSELPKLAEEFPKLYKAADIKILIEELEAETKVPLQAEGKEKAAAG